MSTTHKELANAAEANRIICNDATEYCQLFAAHLANSELAPPLTSALVGRIVRSKIDIHA